MYKKEQFKDGELGINPFVAHLEIHVVKKPIDKQYYLDKDGILLPAEYPMEADPVCKLYADADSRKWIAKQLSPRGKDLMLWIMYEIKYGEDYVIINSKRYMSESDITAVNTYRDALNNLIKNNVIQKTIKNTVFWFNPRYFYKGDRVAKFKKQVKEK